MDRRNALPRPASHGRQGPHQVALGENRKWTETKILFAQTGWEACARKTSTTMESGPLRPHGTPKGTICLTWNRQLQNGASEWLLAGLMFQASLMISKVTWRTLKSHLSVQLCKRLRLL